MEIGFSCTFSCVASHRDCVYDIIKACALHVALLLASSSDSFPLPHEKEPGYKATSHIAYLQVFSVVRSVHLASTSDYAKA